MIAPAKRKAAEVDLAMSVAADAPKADEPIVPKQRRLRGRARAEVAKAPVIEGPSSKRPPTLSPGTKLVRIFKGVKHTVVVMEGGKFEWRGQFWKSLSSVAKAISGQHCSGPAFFGLKGRTKKGEAS